MTSERLSFSLLSSYNDLTESEAEQSSVREGSVYQSNLEGPARWSLKTVYVVSSNACRLNASLLKSLRGTYQDHAAVQPVPTKLQAGGNFVSALKELPLL